MHKTGALTLRDLSFWRQNILGWHLWIKSVFLLKFSLLSKTVPRYLHSVTLSTFMPSIKRSGMTAGDFSKISQHFLCFLYIQVKGIIPAPVTEPFTFSKINRIWVGEIFQCRIVRVFYDWLMLIGFALYVYRQRLVMEAEAEAEAIQVSLSDCLRIQWSHLQHVCVWVHSQTCECVHVHVCVFCVCEREIVDAD